MGKYYVIDPCYVVPADLWHAKWQEPDMNCAKFDVWLADEFDATVYDGFGGVGYYAGVAVDSGCAAVMPITSKLDYPHCGDYMEFDTKAEAVEYADQVFGKDYRLVDTADEKQS